LLGLVLQLRGPLQDVVNLLGGKTLLGQYLPRVCHDSIHLTRLGIDQL
jgi:hypothetical protein